MQFLPERHLIACINDLLQNYPDAQILSDGVQPVRDVQA